LVRFRHVSYEYLVSSRHDDRPKHSPHHEHDRDVECDDRVLEVGGAHLVREGEEDQPRLVLLLVAHLLVEFLDQRPVVLAVVGEHDRLRLNPVDVQVHSLLVFGQPDHWVHHSSQRDVVALVRVGGAVVVEGSREILESLRVVSQVNGNRLACVLSPRGSLRVKMKLTGLLKM